jgi:nucleoside 2-deoxyribosyltransferase
VFSATVVKVLIAAPGDTADEVAAITKSLHGWNGRRAQAQGVVLLPRHWQSDTVPLLHEDGAQAVINSQIVDDADIAVAVFDIRLGRATLGAVSGTAYEIERTSNAGKPVHVYFSAESIDRKNLDLDEFSRLLEFRKQMESKGLVQEYTDPTNLGYLVRDAVEHDLTQMSLGSAVPAAASPDENAMPRLRYDKYDKVLVVENLSDTVRAEQLTLEIPEGAYLIEYDDEPEDLAPRGGKAQWDVVLFMQSPNKVKVKLKWLENGEPRSDTQTVYF